MIEKEYKKHFKYIIIIYPTLRWNKTYHFKDWTKNDDKFWLIEPKDNLYQWIRKLLQLLANSETLFIIDYIIANKDLDKRRQPLLELAISGRYQDHYLSMAIDTVSFGNTKKFAKAGQGHFRVVPERKARSQDYT